jgi:23S rRNA pseudouridine955/2504/2580 synthase/23S rRNA pseudouridine1911/1915/1917 synthase
MIRLDDHILAEEPGWVAVNKPAGLLSIPDREGNEVSLKSLLRHKYGEIFTIHRLDKDTSGLILFARSEENHKYLSKQFEERQTLKLYRGLVQGELVEKKGSLDAPIAEHPAADGRMIIHRKGKPSLTDYEVLEEFGIYSWIEFRIHTGRTHQIRIHMKELGHPIVCDPLYGDGKPVLVSSIRRNFKLSKNEEEERPILGRLALHSLKLGFQDMNGAPIELEAPIPKDLRATLQQLERRKSKK